MSAVVTVAGVNGDFFSQSGGRSYPSGIVMAKGALVRVPTPARVSIGFDTNGSMHVGRISFSGTWKGTGQRRPVEGVNQQPRGNQTILFTPAWGSSTPNLSNAAHIVLEPFPDAAIGTDLNATVSAVGTGQVAIPSDGAVIVATGADAAKLQAEAPLDTQVAVRLILPDAWSSVVSAVGGGPQLVKGGKPLFTTGENFDPIDLATRQPRAAVGQLSDGRVILVTVDGGRPGYSVGMTSDELAKMMAGRRSRPRSRRTLRHCGVRRRERPMPSAVGASWCRMVQRDEAEFSALDPGPVSRTPRHTAFCVPLLAP